jgi:hypothetical protein
MREKDIQRMEVRTYNGTKSTPWTDPFCVNVIKISEPQEAQYGYCQSIDCELPDGAPVVLNYFFEDTIAAIDPEYTGDQMYKVKWLPDKEMYKGIPTGGSPPAKDMAVAREATDWNAINLGKCRHGILCAEITKNGIDSIFSGHPDDLLPKLGRINKLAHFSMTGEVLP